MATQLLKLKDGGYGLNFFKGQKNAEKSKNGRTYILFSATLMTVILAHPPLGDNIKERLVSSGQQIPEDTYCEFLPFMFQTHSNPLEQLNSSVHMLERSSCCNCPLYVQTIILRGTQESTSV